MIRESIKARFRVSGWVSVRDSFKAGFKARFEARIKVSVRDSF